MNRTQFRKLDIILTKEDYRKAELFSKFHKTCVNFIKKHNNFHGNHTGFINNKIDHEYYIWHIALNALKKHLLLNRNIEVRTWEDKFETKKIINIINKSVPTKEDINYVHNYVCNKYHIKLANGKTYDVRTALTKFNPTSNWNFIFPLEKSKTRKNDVILLYCIGTERHIGKIIFAGSISHTTIKQCPVLKKGQKTKFGITNKITGYTTVLNKHYTY